ncbi:MAG: AmmeMemoRadiSam system protein B [bacterium]|nr:AmmeMemoRadiSam system protein B [bacterium]
MSPASSASRVRPSAIAGRWYSDDPQALRQELLGYLNRVDKLLSNVTVRALVAPHAGYAYSGLCAAYAFRQLHQRPIERVFILGPSHHMHVRGASVDEVDAYETPLGLVPVDRAALAALRAHPLVHAIPAAHSREHSLEIELPFLQLVLTNFRIVPLIIGDLSPDEARQLGAHLRSLLGPRDLIVASTDFTHYGPAFGYAPFRDKIRDRLTQLDMGAAERVLARDINGMFRYAAETGITWDGVTVCAVMAAALPDNIQAQLLKYYKSGDADNDYRHSVSYVAIAFFEPTPAPSPTTSETPSLSSQEKQTLLRIARDTLEAHVRGKPLPDLSSYDLTPRLRTKTGAFVTLHKHGQLRGCIGYIEGRAPLAQTVQENACNAATRDPRFPPVQPAELKDIDIEISVMSPLHKAASPSDVIPGVHGVLLKKGLHQGVFLPQVATEQGWDRETFLRHLGLKAGLDVNAYKTAELWLFTAEVFGETHK